MKIENEQSLNSFQNSILLATTTSNNKSLSKRAMQKKAWQQSHKDSVRLSNRRWHWKLKLEVLYIEIIEILATYVASAFLWLWINGTKLLYAEPESSTFLNKLYHLDKIYSLLYQVQSFLLSLSCFLPRT